MIDILTTRLTIDEKKVKTRMRALGIQSYQELADRTKEAAEAGISMRTVYNAVGSSEWASKTLYALADALECSPTDLLTADVGKGIALAGNNLILEHAM